MKSGLLTFFLLLSQLALTQFSGADKQAVDSLQNLRKTSKDKLVLAKTMLSLSEWYSIVSVDSVINFATQSKEIAQVSLKQTKNKDRINEFEKCVAGADNNIAYSYFNKGDFSQALYYNKLALDRWKKLEQDDGTVRSLNNIGAIYRQLEEFPKALEFYKEALAYNLKDGDAGTIAITYNNLGSIYKTLNQDTKSLESYKKAIHYRRKAKDKRGEANTLNNIGTLYKKWGKMDSASYYFNRSYSLIHEVGDPIGIAHASSNVGDMALQNKDYKKAESLGKEALEIGKASGMLMIIEQSSSLLERVYAATGRWKEAFEMQKLHLETIMKINSEEAKRSADNLAMQYEYEQKKEIDKIENDKKLAIAKNQQEVQKFTTYLIIGFTIFIFILCIILYERYRKVNEQKFFIEKQNNERKVLLQEIHHRVKNNFQIISSLLKLQSYQDDNPKLQKSFQDAINRIHSMASVHEIIYKQNSLAKVDMQVYFDSLINQLKRSLGRSDVEISVEINPVFLDVDHTIPLGIILNELFTNSIKHAFVNESNSPQIFVRFTQDGAKFKFEYGDNGIGFIPQNDRQTLGIELIDTLVDQLNGDLKYSKCDEWSSKVLISF